MVLIDHTTMDQQQQPPNNGNSNNGGSSSGGGGLMDEFHLMKDHKYRVYMSNVDKALKNFEYTSEWADLISALGKLNKVISNYPKYQIIPRRIKISKRLAQCMHPALPSGVHLKALESYDVIFQNTGPDQLASELFIYSAGLFPLLGYSAMNVRPTLLGIYEKYFVPLGDRLRPALSGFLSGVLPGYEAGLDYFEQTNSLLEKVAAAVGDECFYTCLWECVATNASIRLPAVSYILDHFSRRMPLAEQSYFLGINHDIMMSGLCACLNDSLILVQRNALEYLLIAFPVHNAFPLQESDLIRLATNALNTILRRDMSLNRRLYTWLLGTEIAKADGTNLSGDYFDANSKRILVRALKLTLKMSINTDPIDLRPYKILIALLDKAEIGPQVLDFIMLDVIRTMALSLNYGNSNTASNLNNDVSKSVNLLFATFDPEYIWNYMTSQYERSAKRAKYSLLTTRTKQRLPSVDEVNNRVKIDVDSGLPSLIEVCYLTEFLLETISLEMYNETTRVFLPKVFLAIVQILTQYSEELSHENVIASLNLCMKIVGRVQPMIMSPSKSLKKLPTLKKIAADSIENFANLEKSKSDSKLNQACDKMKDLPPTTDKTEIDDGEIKRSKSNQNMKRSPRKNQKKSKSFSKLGDMDGDINCIPTGQLLASDRDEKGSEPKLKKAVKKSPLSKTKGKKVAEDALVADVINDESPSTSAAPELEDDISAADDDTSFDSEMLPTTSLEGLEQCIKQYEIFFQVYLSQQIFRACNINIEGANKESADNVDTSLDDEYVATSMYYLKDYIVVKEDKTNETIKSRIDNLFETLSNQTNTSSSDKLRDLLTQSIIQDNDDFKIVLNQPLQPAAVETEHSTDQKLIQAVMDLKLVEPLRNAIKLASNLLVELSTFPNYGQTVDSMPPAIDNGDSSLLLLPSWLKTLTICCCYLRTDKDTQINCISSLFEMVSLLKASQYEQHSISSPGVTYVVMLPLLRLCHVQAIENKTRIFQTLTSTLWDYLSDDNVDRIQVASLLYQLHNSLDSGLVETVISKRLINIHLNWQYDCDFQDDLDSDQVSSGSFANLHRYTRHQMDSIRIFCPAPGNSMTACNNILTGNNAKMFRKFELLWHLGRDRTTKSFDRLLLLMFDHLELPQHIGIRNIITTWLQESLVRGDFARLLQPLLMILLDAQTKRISVVHAHIQRNGGGSCNISDIWYDLERTPMNGRRHSVANELMLNDDASMIAVRVNNNGNVSHKRLSISNESGSMGSASNCSRNTNSSGNKKSPIRKIQKRIFGASGGGIVSGGTYSDKHDHHLNLSNSSNISLIINPLETSKQDDDTDSSDDDCKLLRKTDRNPARFSLIEKDDPDIIDNEEKYHEKCVDEEEEDEGEDVALRLSSEAGSSSHNDDDVTRTSCDSVEEPMNSRFVGRCNNITDRMSEHDRTKNKKNYCLREVSGDEVSTVLPTSADHSCAESSSQKVIAITNDRKYKKYKNRSSQRSETPTEIEAPKETLPTFNWERSKQNVNILRENNKKKKRFYDKIHPLHSHMLLYYGCFNTTQVLYSLKTLTNLVTNDPRTFLCLAMTTGILDSRIKSLLIRHRKSVGGCEFEGVIANTEYSHAYRSSMMLEGLITTSLCYMRSYYQKTTNTIELPNQIPMGHDIRENCNIQFASIELLTIFCNELISVVRDMGKRFSSYVSDLMSRCKLQKIVLHCVLTSVLSMNSSDDITYTDEILRFNDPGDMGLHNDSMQISLLKLLLAVTKLEYEVTQNGADLVGAAGNSNDGRTSNKSNSQNSPTRTTPNTPTANACKYLSNCPISQQPMFLSAIMNALQSDHLRHLHKNWTDFTISALNCFLSLTNIVISVVHQICNNLDKIILLRSSMKKLPPDYTLSQLEALTMLVHYCLLDSTQQMTLSHVFSNGFNTSQTGILSQISSSSSSNQLFNNFIHVFLTTPPQIANETTQLRASMHLAARNAVLSHLPRIVACVAALWDSDIGQDRLVNKQLLEFLGPISLHHKVNFLAAIAVVWQERGDNFHKQTLLNAESDDEAAHSLPEPLPKASPEQLSLVRLISGIKLMPVDSFVQTLQQVIKQPPAMHHPPPGLSVDTSALEVLYFYMKSSAEAQMNDSWPSILALLKDTLTLSPPSQFVALAILSEFVHRCPQMPFQDKKDLRELHDLTSKLVESISNVGGAGLEQTTWLRRNLAVKEDSTQSQESQLMGNQQYSVQALSVLATLLANLLDISYGSLEKDKVVTLITVLMVNITPYLKNHSVRNIPSFMACSSLISNLSTYQYSRKAWRKDVLDLLLDPAFFQMDICCLPYWKTILDSLMTCDTTTFRELMNRVSLTQTGSLNIFASKELEYEQRAAQLKRLAFIIFCSEFDQYHKYMPEIQEQLANSLRLPHIVPSVQAAVLLCFRVLLLRMSPDHVTSLWPIIIAEMVQVLLSMEQELKVDSEEFSNHIKVLSGLNSQWVTNTSNGLHSNGNPQWRSVQLETAKLLELGCVLPATNLPHFQMYRWAFVGGLYDGSFPKDIVAGGLSHNMQSFVPHVTRIARLMDLSFTTHPRESSYRRGKHLSLTCQSIQSLKDLYGFFSTLSITWPPYQFSDIDKDVKSCLQEIESILALDFLEKMSQSANTSPSTSLSAGISSSTSLSSGIGIMGSLYTNTH